MTEFDVKAEHDEAWSRFTPNQRRAVDRYVRACQRTNFNGKHWRDNLKAIFATEAEDRSNPKAGHA